MNERDFVSKRREGWDRLAAIIEKANRRSVRALSREEILALGPLYRRASSDLAYARAHAVNSDMALHLNDLVGRAHALLYEAETSGNPMRSLVNFYLFEFPTLLQKHVRYFLAAVGVSVAGLVFAWWLVANRPEKIDLFIPEGLRSSVEVWKSKKVSDDAHVDMSAELMVHNFQVGVMSFAWGVAGIYPDGAALFENGAMLGALGALMSEVHGHATFWPGILPHGIAELTAIFICGGAGFMLGLALLAPGPYRRVDAFVRVGNDAIKLVLGTIPLFIFAGIIEGMFSHLALPGALRLTFAGVNGVLWYLYLFLPRARPESDPALPAMRNLTAA